MLNLKGFERSYLMRRAHELKPVVMIGKGGMTPGVQEAIDNALASHELVKVRFVDYKEERRSLAQEMAKASGAFVVTVVGNNAVLYKPHEDPAKRRITLPSL